MVEMDERLWAIAHMLAADLALNRVSKNLVQDVLTYGQHYPDTPVMEYAAQLAALTDHGHFQAGKSGPYEREDLVTAFQRMRWWPDKGYTPLLLAWVTRLIDYYKDPAHCEEAIRASRLKMADLRPGQALPGKVREVGREAVWVRVEPGQWGRAARKLNVDVGDAVEVNIQGVTNPATFTVEILSVTRRAPRPEVATPPPVAAPPPELPPQRDAEIRQGAEDFMAFLQQKWAEEAAEEAEEDLDDAEDEGEEKSRKKGKKKKKRR